VDGFLAAHSFQRSSDLIIAEHMLERRPWAQTLAIVVAIIALLNPILGTVLGIYTLWVLLPSDAEAEWQREARAV
jgi:hypothetical protein